MRSTTILNTLVSLLAVFTAGADARLSKKHGDIAARNHIRSDLAERSTKPKAIKPHIAQAPYWVVYTQSDYSKTQVLPTAAQLKGYNVFALAFWESTTGGIYKAQEFTKLSASTRAWIINDYHSHGISFIVSAFGFGDNTVTDKRDPIQTANKLAAFVKQYQLDGVDIDWEDFGGLAEGGGKAEAWLVSFTTQLRAKLPAGQYLLSHAPVAPWFTTNTTMYPGGAYRHVHQKVGNMIDFYNLQFYNQGTDYTVCSSLITKNINPKYPHTSLSEIHQYTGIPWNKLVIGKPAVKADAYSGFTDMKTLSGCLKQAKALGWNGGQMLWAYPDASMSTIQTIRSQSFPV